MKKKYHSALKEEHFTEYGISYLERDGNKVFKMDVIDFNFDEYQNCDVLYSEPAWLDGYEKFLIRAGCKDKSGYKDYIESLSKIIELSKCPVVMIIGKHAIKNLPNYSSSVNIKIHGYKTFAYGWRINLSNYDIITNYDLINELAKIFYHVGDFNCGYGNTGLIFKKYGKNFTMSDINEKCVTYISKYVL